MVFIVMPIANIYNKEFAMKKRVKIVKPKGFTKVERPAAKAVGYTGLKVAQLRQAQVVHASASR